MNRVRFHSFHQSESVSIKSVYCSKSRNYRRICEWTEFVFIRSINRSLYQSSPCIVANLAITGEYVNEPSLYCSKSHHYRRIYEWNEFVFIRSINQSVEIKSVYCSKSHHYRRICEWNESVFINQSLYCSKSRLPRRIKNKLRASEWIVILRPWWELYSSHHDIYR
jgi:hypothetical protein